jgi:thiamine pyrophosphate-dependent acetolactate synthase large subunit-like protein
VNGGDRVAEALRAHGVPFLFTLCGGHISPILVGAKRLGIRVIDVRHEATAVFAADAVARLTGIPGVAAVTAGPGCTNTITAIKNAQLAQSPVVLLGGATGTILKGRGALQDIDQLALFEPHVKWAASVRRVKDLEQTLYRAFHHAQEGVPGPVFVECPVDLLYDEPLVAKMYGAKANQGTPKGLGDRAMRWYLRRHVKRLFAGVPNPGLRKIEASAQQEPSKIVLKKVRRYLRSASRPVLMVGSQALLDPGEVAELASAVESLGIPVFLTGMARGLLGRGHRLQIRHQRRQALRRADLVILAGVPCDFRLDYGRQIGGRAKVVAANRDGFEMDKNRRPDLAVVVDPGVFLKSLAGILEGEFRRDDWLAELRQRDEDRHNQIVEASGKTTEFLNPLALVRQIENVVSEDSVLIVDGGDFVATASYVVSPRGPLSWLDPGVFGTLGVGAGFALGAKLCRPEAEIWILYGDGSAAFSLAEFDTFVRHDLPVIAVVGNDASWAQIARDQIDLLQDDVGTVLRRTDYDVVAAGYGGKGLRLHQASDMVDVLATAKIDAASGRPVLINALLGKSDFRQGSISV